MNRTTITMQIGDDHRPVEPVDRVDESLPMPGQAKIVSVTTAKATREPNSRPMTVTIGIRMYLRTWTPITRRGGRPFARANLT